MLVVSSKHIKIFLFKIDEKASTFVGEWEIQLAGNCLYVLWSRLSASCKSISGASASTDMAETIEKFLDKCDRKAELMLFYESQRTSNHMKRQMVALKYNRMLKVDIPFIWSNFLTSEVAWSYLQVNVHLRSRKKTYYSFRSLRQFYTSFTIYWKFYFR